MDTPVTVAEPRKAALAFIFAIVLLDVIALGIVIPVLPRLIETMLGGDTSRAAEIFGYFATAWALMQFTFSPVLGALSDRYGRRPVLLVSMTGHGLDYILMALAPSLAWLFVGRIISGITAASFSTAYAYIADVTPPEKRAGAFGMVGAAFGVGFVLAQHWVDCSERSIRVCRSGWLPRSAWPTPPTAGSFCPSRCHVRDAWPSASRVPTRLDRCGCWPSVPSCSAWRA
jgi:MFS family permease